MIGQNSLHLGLWAYPEDRVKMFEILQRQGRVKDFEAQFRRKSGEIAYTLFSAEVIEAAGQQYLLGLVRDITERRQTEESLLLSEERYGRLFEDASLGIFRSTPEGEIINVNPAYVRMFGFDSPEKAKSEVKNVAVDLYVDPSRRNEIVRMLLDGEGSVRAENLFRRKDGSIFTADLHIWTVCDKEGKLLYLEGFLEDITERKRAEDALRESEAKYRTLVENIPQKVFMKDTDSCFVSINEHLARDLGILSADVFGKTDYDFFPRELADKYRMDDKRIMKTGVTEELEEHYVLLGKEVWIQTVKTPVRDINGKIVGVFGIFWDITERKRAEKALRMSEERFSRFFRASPIGTSITRLSNGQFADINDAFLVLFGYTREEVIGQDPLRMGMWANPEDRAKMVEVLQEQGRIQDFETRFRRKSGEIMDVLISAEVIEMAGEQHILGIIYDFTERKQLLEEIQSIGRFADENPNPVIRVSGDGKLLYANRNSATLLKSLGCKPGQTLPDDWRQRALQVLSSGCSKEMELTCEELIYSLLLVPVSDLGYLNIYGLDITERRSAEAERARLIMAIEQVDEGIMITDENWIIQFVNPAFERITSYSGEELIGRHARVLKSDAQDQAFYTKIRNTLASGQVWSGLISAKKKDGTLYQVQALSSPVKDASGKIINYINIRRDVTLENKLERELRQAQKMESIGTLAGGIAHDFNNILGIILGYAELAQTTATTESPQHKHLTQVRQAALRAKDLVSQILTFSRQTEQQKQPLQIAPVVKEALKLLRSSLPTTIEVRPEIEIPPGNDVVLADPTQIHQVLMNLCTNAAHAMRTSGGVLSVHLSEVDASAVPGPPGLRTGPYLRLAVTDTGDGMDAAVMERIFDPYFTTKGVGEGTGLGLSVVQGIVENHGGVITVYSEPGRGTTFHIFFPTIEEHAAPEVVTNEVSPHGNERILFVDDEKSIVGFGKDMLEGLGYKVTAKTSSLEALETFRAEPGAFDLVITDMTMPVLTGAALAQRLWAIRKDIPIILCSGFSQLIDGSQAKELGIREYVTKPYTLTTLAKAVRKALDQK
jgi:PAS domain S-box-containing protein